MHAQQWGLLVVIAVSGGAVIGSYVQGFSAHPGGAAALWGGVAGGLRVLNYCTMILAALGFFAFSYWLFFRLNPGDVQVFGGGFWIFYLIFPVILVPSALWMPLTFAYLEHPGPGGWIAVRAALALVGIGSLALLAALISAKPHVNEAAYWSAVAGAAAFCLQTSVLDMLVWPALFRA